MAYKKRQLSPEVGKAEKRLTGMSTIDPMLDLGSGLSITIYSAEIERIKKNNDKYNKLLFEADASLSELIESEKALAEYSDRMLSGVGSKYGYNSFEYEKAGGTRKIERKKNTPKNPPKNGK